MSIDYWILTGVWVLSFLLVFIIPHERRRLALVAFLFKQALTYLLGLVAVELQLLEYPVRELASINRTSLTYEYMAYPMVCAVFNVFYPSHRSFPQRLCYYFFFCTILTAVEMLLERYTHLVLYLEWKWWWTWVSLLATFFMTHVFCVLFFRDVERVKHSGE
ncbi:MAG: hypothetical protein K0R57_4599 [Paenibacillaceae bacterium]|jgi:hypothetical protein|nr:hypothetical protein [Paenibacillaceae bacterium]